MDLMSLYQRDFILRMIEAVGATLRRVLKRREAGDLAGARLDVAQSMGEVLGPSASMVPMVDSQTAANLVSDPQRIALYCRLLDVDADLLGELGHPDRSERARQRALELLLELVLRRVELPDETIEHVQGLQAQVGVGRLPARYRDAWDAAARLTVTGPG